MTIYIFLAALLVMAASLAGVIFINKTLSEFLTKNLKVLMAFAGGVFAVLVYSLFAETLEADISLPLLAASALGGALFLEGMDWLLPHSPHDHNKESAHEHGHIDAHRVLLGDAIHNIGDGIILVPAFLANVWLGIGTALAVFLHELVQETAEFFVLKGAGYSTKQALARNFAVSSTILIGVVAALAAASVERFEAPLLAFAGGAFTYVLLRDLLPDIARSVRIGGKATHFVLAALIGAGLMLGVQILTPEHGHGELDEHAGTHRRTRSVIASHPPIFCTQLRALAEHV